MNINGRDVGLVYTVGVLCNIADYMKDNPDVSGVRLTVFAAVEMSKAYCAIHGGEPLTEAEVLAMPGSKFQELDETIKAVQENDSEQTVETEPVKEKGKKKDAAEKQD